MGPPDSRSGPPPARAARDIKAPATALDVSRVTGELAARRCFSWRNAGSACGCAYVSDCLLNALPALHGDDCCTGMFGADGRWIQHCQAATA